MRHLTPEVESLAQQQHGLLSMPQLAAHGFRRREIDRRVARGSWRWVSATVVALQIAPLSRQAMLRAAALHYERCALGGSSALEIRGLPEPKGGSIHIIGMPAGRLTPLQGCVVHTSKEFEIVETFPDRVSPAAATLQVLRWARSDRQGVFQAIWAIQQGLVSLEQLQATVREMKPSPGSACARKRMSLIDPGVHSIYEFDFAKECGRRGFPSPRRQQHRPDSTGVMRYTDVEFTMHGQTLIVEIDGKQHLDCQTWISDAWRANEMTRDGALLLRIPALALRLDPEPFFTQLRQRLHAMALHGATSDRPFRVV